jgi:uncharacterized coiled-coil protein SlyX
MDEGETAENAAIRELEEETGFQADNIQEVSDVIVNDPGVFEKSTVILAVTQRSSGMTNANMKLVLVNVTLEDELKLPKQKLDAGEFIVPRVLELSKLHDELKGMADYLFHVAEVASRCDFIGQNTLKRSVQMSYVVFRSHNYTARVLSWTRDYCLLQSASISNTRYRRKEAV